MRGFLPNDYTTVYLNDGDRVDLFAEINHIRYKQRGAYFTDYDRYISL